MRNQAFFGLIVIISMLTGCTDGISDLRSQFQLSFAITSSPNDYRAIWASQEGEVIAGTEQEDGSWILDVAANVPTTIAGERHRAINPSDPLSTDQSTEWQHFEGTSGEVIPQPGQRTRVDLRLNRNPSVAITFRPVFTSTERFTPRWTGPLILRLTDTQTGTDLATTFPANRLLELPSSRTFLVHHGSPTEDLNPSDPQFELTYTPASAESRELNLGSAPALPTENLVRDLEQHDVTQPLVSSDLLATAGFDPDYEMLCRVRTEEGCLPEADNWVECSDLFTESTHSAIRVSVRYKDIADYGCGLISFTASQSPQEPSTQSLQISTNLPNEHPYLSSNGITLSKMTQDGSVAVDAAGLALPAEFTLYVDSNEEFIPASLTLEPLSIGTACTPEATAAVYSDLVSLYRVPYSCQFSSVPSGLSDGTIKVLATGQRSDGTELSTFGVLRVVGEPITRDRLVVTRASLEGGEASAYQSTIQLNVQVALTTTQDMTCEINNMTFRLPTPGVELPITEGPTLAGVRLTHLSGGPVTQWLAFDLGVPAGTDLTQMANPITLDIDLDSNCTADSSQTDSLSVPIYLKQDAPQWVTSSTDTEMLHFPAAPWHDESSNFIPLGPIAFPVTGLTTDRDAYRAGVAALPTYPHHHPHAGTRHLKTETSESLGAESQPMDFQVHQVTQPILLTETQIITRLSNSTPANDAALSPRSYAHNVDNPKKLLYDPIASTVVVIGTDTVNALEFVDVTPGTDAARLVNRDWMWWANPCGASEIIDAVVSTDYTLLDTEPADQGHSTYQSQLSLIVEKEDGSYSHCTIRNYADENNQAQIDQPLPTSDSAASCVPNQGASGDFGAPTTAAMGLGYFPSLDTFVLATSGCVGSYQVHSPNTSGTSMTNFRRLDHPVSGNPWKIETDPFSGHFLVHYEEQSFAGTSDGADAPTRHGVGLFEFFPDGIHARWNTSLVLADSTAWDHLNARPYTSGHPYYSESQGSEPWFIALPTSVPPDFESDGFTMGPEQVSWHNISINAGARLGFAVQRSGGQTSTHIVAFNLENYQTNPDASWPIGFTDNDTRVIDMIQLGPQAVGGLPEKLHPGGIYTLNVMGHAPNDSRICIQGACVPAMAVGPHTLKFQVPLAWKALDANIPAHITVMSQGLISSPNPATTTLGPTPLPWSYEIDPELVFTCDSCSQVDFVTEGSTMGLVGQVTSASGSTESTSVGITYSLTQQLSSLELHTEHSLNVGLRPGEFIQSRDRRTTLAYTTHSDVYHVDARVIPHYPEAYRDSSDGSFYMLASYYNGLEEIFTNNPFETSQAISNTEATDSMSGFEIVAVELLEDNAHVAALATNGETFKLLTSNVAHHTAPMYSRPWLTHFSSSSLLADWNGTTLDTQDSTYDIATLNYANKLEKLIITRKENPSIKVVSFDGTIDEELELSDLRGENCFGLPDGELLHIDTHRVAGGPAAATFAIRDSSTNAYDKIGAVFIYAPADNPDGVSTVCRLSNTWPAMVTANIGPEKLPSIAYSEANQLIAMTVPAQAQHNLFLTRVSGRQGATGTARELIYLELPHAPTSITFSPTGSTIHTVGHNSDQDESEFSLVKTQIVRSPRP